MNETEINDTGGHLGDSDWEEVLAESANVRFEDLEVPTAD